MRPRKHTVGQDVVHAHGLEGRGGGEGAGEGWRRVNCASCRTTRAREGVVGIEVGDATETQLELLR